MFVQSLLSFGLLTRLLPGGGPPPPPLRLTPTTSSSNHALTVVIFADLHFGEEEHGWGVAQDANSTRVMDAVLDAEAAAGLVVLNGDLVTGENTLRANASGYVRRVVAPMRRRGIPWASTYGNHDSQFNLSREALLRAEQAFPRLSYTRRMDARLPGVTNYYLLVRGSRSHGHGDRPVAVLWFFDSRGGACAPGTARCRASPSSTSRPARTWPPSKTAWTRRGSPGSTKTCPCPSRGGRGARRPPRRRRRLCRGPAAGAFSPQRLRGPRPRGLVVRHLALPDHQKKPSFKTRALPLLRATYGVRRLRGVGPRCARRAVVV